MLLVGLVTGLVDEIRHEVAERVRDASIEG